MEDEARTAAGDAYSTISGRLDRSEQKELGDVACVNENGE